MPHLTAQKVAQPKLSPSEWWTAPYADVFSDVDIIYADNPQKAYQILDILIQRATSAQDAQVLYKAYHSKGLYLERQLAFQAAFDNYILASKAVQNKSRQDFAEIQIDIAIMYRSLYRYTDARATYFALIEHCLQHKDSVNLLNASAVSPCPCWQFATEFELPQHISTYSDSDKEAERQRSGSGCRTTTAGFAWPPNM